MIVNGTPGFFPLSKIRSHLKDYYMTANGDIYSTRQQATPRKMTGTPAARNGRASVTEVMLRNILRLPLGASRI